MRQFDFNSLNAKAAIIQKLVIYLQSKSIDSFLYVDNFGVYWVNNQGNLCVVKTN